VRGPRQPKDIERYETAALAGAKLENLARDIKGRNGLVKWSITFRFWEEAPRGEFQCMGATCSNKAKAR
jgi:hypothetical protein